MLPHLMPVCTYIPTSFPKSIFSFGLRISRITLKCIHKASSLDPKAGSMSPNPRNLRERDDSLKSFQEFLSTARPLIPSPAAISSMSRSGMLRVCVPTCRASSNEATSWWFLRSSFFERISFTSLLFFLKSVSENNIKCLKTQLKNWIATSHQQLWSWSYLS